MRISTHYIGRTPNAVTCVLSAFLTILAGSALAVDGLRVPVVSATASAHDGNVPANAVDGSLATRWSAKGDGQWLRLDLGLPTQVGSVKIAWHKGDQRTSLFEVQTSQDGANWTRVLSEMSGGDTTALESYDATDTTARYVRIVGHGNSLDLWNSISEVEVYTPGASAPKPPVVVTNDTPLVVQSVTASGNDGNVPANTLDESLDTRWSANGDGQWIAYQFAARSSIGAVNIAWHKGDTRMSLFDIQTSDTGASWKTVYTGASGGTTAGFETYDVADSTAQHLRIVGHGNSLNLWNSIAEVQFQGTNSGGVIVTNPPPKPPTSDGLPSSVLNLTNWKLTLPVNTSHAGAPDEFLQPELHTYKNAEYFHLNSTLDGVVFRAHCGGYTTSGSGYPRSELREMTSSGGQASWSTTSGTHTMEIRQAIMHLPVVKPHVVVGQIHDAGDDVIVFRLEGSKLFVDQNGVNGPVLTSNYKLGDVFTVKFVARDGGVECYYNGQFIYTYKVSTSGCYFKAGCYTQSNTSKGDAASAYGEVVIYDVKVSHQ